MSTQPTTGSAWIPDDRTFGARLALIRWAKRWNEKEAALACGFPYSTWRRWEEGTMPRDLVDVARQISERTGADEDWILRGRRTTRGGGPGTTESPRPAFSGGGGGGSDPAFQPLDGRGTSASKLIQWRTAA